MQLTAMFELDAKTWTMIVVITGAALWIIRHNANALQMLFFLPLATLFSILANHALVLLHVYQPEKLAEWLVWVIAAATTGNLIAIGMVALSSTLADRR